MHTHSSKTACERCGTCCLKGGPALHFEDRVLLQHKKLRPEQLITIRAGEPVLALASQAPEPARSEIVKIRGAGKEWSCIFFRQDDAGCSIYRHRPLECRLLRCWDPGPLENTAGKNLLCRSDIIEPDDPILVFIERQTEKCSLKDLVPLLSKLGPGREQQKIMRRLTEMVTIDLAIRHQACQRFQLDLHLELFFFGRPLFKILEQFNLK